jgi:hypothetical protein
MKKLYASVLSLLFVNSAALAQAPKENLRILISYQGSGQYLEQALETIEAINTVGTGTTVDYNAGQSVALLPGFEAKAGSVFTAEIKPVKSNNELSLQLRAFPNPFEKSIAIDYYLPADGKVNVWITDAQGKIVGQLVDNQIQSAGQHTIEWNPDSLKAGVYMPVVEANQQKAVSRIVKK